MGTMYCFVFLIFGTVSSLANEDSLVSMKAIIEKQNSRILALELALEKQNAETEKKISSLNQDITRCNNNIQWFIGPFQRKRNTIDKNGRAETENNIAFHAYMSRSEENVAAKHVFKFDQVVTNLGNGYNPLGGTFTAPAHGIYVITWTLFHQASIAYDIVANGVVRASGLGQSSNFDSESGTLVVELNLGESVYVQVSQPSTGTIFGLEQARSSFSGWKL